MNNLHAAAHTELSFAAEMQKLNVESQYRVRRTGKEELSA